MTDLIILAGLLVACCVFVEWRRRRAAAARRAEARRGGAYAFLTDLGWTVGTSRFIPPRTVYVGEIPPVVLEPGPLLFNPDDTFERTYRLRQEILMQAVLPPGRRSVIITGV